jgi:ankyrin repeat protein
MDLAEEDGDETPSSLPSRDAPKHPMARFTHATAPRMRGVIAPAGASITELGQELLDKASIGDVTAIRHLMAVGADPNFVDLEEGWAGVTPLINAATNGHRSAVMSLLVLGAVLDFKDDHGWTALHRAAGKGHGPVVAALVDAGADVSLRDKTGTRTVANDPPVVRLACYVCVRVCVLSSRHGVQRAVRQF